MNRRDESAWSGQNTRLGHGAVFAHYCLGARFILFGHIRRQSVLRGLEGFGDHHYGTEILFSRSS